MTRLYAVTGAILAGLWGCAGDAGGEMAEGEQGSAGAAADAPAIPDCGPGVLCVVCEGERDGRLLSYGAWDSGSPGRETVEVKCSVDGDRGTATYPRSSTGRTCAAGGLSFAFDHGKVSVFPGTDEIVDTIECSWSQP